MQPATWEINIPNRFQIHLRTTVPFVTVHLEIFHCTHHPVIPMSDLYFTLQIPQNLKDLFSHFKIIFLETRRFF